MKSVEIHLDEMKAVLDEMRKDEKRRMDRLSKNTGGNVKDAATVCTIKRLN